MKYYYSQKLEKFVRSNLGVIEATGDSLFEVGAFVLDDSEPLPQGASDGGDENFEELMGLFHDAEKSNLDG